ncbi:uncharacterized protein [Diadema setosum]|uniref:uncharacterized protein n=1 Tax=Diadema setosum TaxID=31175 RepID=UPI003B3AB45C
MSTILAGLPGVQCYLDDVIVYGKDRTEHDTRLNKVLTKLQDAGLRLNPKIRPTVCQDGFFNCDSSCVSISYYCDFEDDCDDGTDESDCVFDDECPPTHFSCGTDDICINKSKRCDLITNCQQSNSDEENCRNDYQEKGYFQCYSGTWIPGSARCDGLIDCLGSSHEDELNCESTHCDEEDQFTCLNGACVNRSMLCIYDFDYLGYMRGCRDGSHLRKAHCESFTCPVYHLKCPDSYCIPLRMRCDVKRDCPNGEDELSCGRRCHFVPSYT